jgi:Family of unknown function (DUF6069)
MITSRQFAGHEVSFESKLGLRVCGVVGALIAASGWWIVAQTLNVSLKVNLHNGRPPQTFGLLFLLGFALGFSILGWFVLAVLDRRTQRSVAIWTTMGIGLLVVSFVPIAIVGASSGTKVILSCIHLSVAAALLTSMRRSSAHQLHQQGES